MSPDVAKTADMCIR